MCDKYCAILKFMLNTHEKTVLVKSCDKTMKEQLHLKL